MDEKKKADFCREFGLVSSTIQTICKNRAKILIIKPTRCTNYSNLFLK